MLFMGVPETLNLSIYQITSRKVLCNCIINMQHVIFFQPEPERLTLVSLWGPELISPALQSESANQFCLY